MNRRWASALLVLVALVPLVPAFGVNLPVKRYALFVGANVGGPAQQPLLYAQKDALKVQQVMQEVGGVAASDRILLLDPRPSEVREALAALGQRMASPSDTRRTEFLFYYSGHSDDLGLLLGEESLSYKALRDSLQAVPADVRIAILDSCSSGAFARTKGGVQRAPFLDQDASQMKGHAFLTSSSENEASQESDTLQGSFFTHYLVSGLRGGADRLGDGLITLNEAYEYAFQNTLARTESTKAGPQHPSYEIQLSGTGNLVLSDVKAASARLELGGDVAGKLYVRGLSGQLFAEVAKDAGTPLVLALPAGAYTVTAVTTQRSLSTKVTLANQDSVTVTGRDFKEQELARFAVRGPSTEPEPEPESLDLQLKKNPWLKPGWWGENRTLALNPLVDLTETLRGLQASGLVSVNSQRLQGVQASGIGSISQGEVAGVQTAGVFSIAAGGLAGLQLAGVFNIAAGTSSGYVQGAGVFNIARGSYQGIQSAGVLNVAEGFQGIQLSPVNVAGEVKGFQVGVVNINTHIEGAGLGLIHISPDAYYHPTILWDDAGSNHALFQWGMGWLYWLAGVVSESDEKAWESLGGVGVKIENRALFWDTDAGWSSSFDADRYVQGRPYLRSSVGFQSGWFAVEGGLLLTPTDEASVVVSKRRTLDIGPWEFQAQPRWYAGFRFF